MNLDFYPGQRCVFVEVLSIEDYLMLVSAGAAIPTLDATYTVDRAFVCDCCGVVLLRLVELSDGRIGYPAQWFRPVEPQAMEVLRGLLVPDGGLPAREREDA